jgi:hypothetical protein
VTAAAAVHGPAARVRAFKYVATGWALLAGGLRLWAQPEAQAYRGCGRLTPEQTRIMEKIPLNLRVYICTVFIQSQKTNNAWV